MKYRDTPVVIFNIHISEKVIAVLLVVITLVAFYLSSASTILWWMLVASLIFVFGHAFFYTPAPVDEFGFGLPPDTTPPPNFTPVPTV